MKKSLDKSYLAILSNISTVSIHMYIYIYLYIRTIGIEGSLEVKLLTIWTDEKQRWEESEKRSKEERRSQERKSQKKEDPGARKGRKVAKPFLFPMICGSGGSKSRLAKAAGAEPAGWPEEMKNCTPLWREAHLQVKRLKKTPHVPSTF